MEAIIGAIPTVGFPVVAAILCAYFAWTIVKNYREDCNSNIKEIRESAEKREERLYDQMSKFEEALSNFNDTLISIDKRLERLEDGIEK